MSGPWKIPVCFICNRHSNLLTNEAGKVYVENSDYPGLLQDEKEHDASRVG